MPLFTHKQKYAAHSGFLAATVVMAIVAMNLQWSQIERPDGKIHIFLTSAQRCGTGLNQCVSDCYICICDDRMSGNAALGLMSISLVLAVFGRFAMYRARERSGGAQWDVTALISMSLAFLTMMFAQVSWAVGCHSKAGNEVFAADYGAGFNLSIVCTVLFFLQAVYYGRITGLCGGGMAKSEASL